MSIKYEKLACRWYLADGIGATQMPALGKQNELARPASPIVGTAVRTVLVPEVLSASSLATSCDG